MTGLAGNVTILDELRDYLEPAEGWRDEELTSSLRIYGLQSPILLWVNPSNGQNVLIDGHRRLKHCKKAKVELTDNDFQFVKLADLDAVKAFMASLQDSRRSLPNSVAETITAGQELKKMARGKAAQAKGQKPMTGKERQRRTDQRNAAKGFDTLSKHNPKLAAEVMSAEKSPVSAQQLREAAKKVKADPTKEKEAAEELARQAEKTKAWRRGEIKRLRQPRVGTNFRLHLNKFLNKGPFDKTSIGRKEAYRVFKAICSELWYLRFKEEGDLFRVDVDSDAQRLDDLLNIVQEGGLTRTEVKAKLKEIADKLEAEIITE